MRKIQANESVLLGELRRFEDAAFQLSECIDLLGEEKLHQGSDMVPDHYPFEKSFDEVCRDITLWRQAIERMIIRQRRATSEKTN